nr:hypothetical protein [Tanacetum cinerariifolium]
MLFIMPSWKPVKIYKPTNNNLRTSSNTSRADHDKSLRMNRVDWRDDIDDEPDNQELKAHYTYMAQIQEVTPDAPDNSGPIFDTEPLHKVHNDNGNYNVFANDKKHPEQPKFVNDTYLEEQGDTNITIDSLDMSTNGETVDQDDDDLARERDLLASLIEKLKFVKCERLEKELSKSNITSKSFESLQQHAIDRELALKQYQQQIKNDKAFKENQSKVFLKEREQYFEIQDLKAQLQDKGIAISELKKLIETMKGKSVETKFEIPTVIRQPNAFKSQRQSVL